jgi:SNF2 family DNA or RNA helicase
MLKKENLRQYQVDLVKQIKAQDKLLLAVDMGLGKTISALTAIEEMPDVKKILIVAPLRVAKFTWPDEFNNWEHLKDISFTRVMGTPKQRDKALNEDVRVYIINRENITWLNENLKFNFDMIIWDESSSLKSAKMKTQKGELTRYAALLKIADNTKRIVFLTGTPTPNGLQDLYGQIYPLDKEVLGKSKWKFLQEYFTDVSRDPNYAIWQPRSKSYEIVMDKVKNLIVKMKSEDYLELPEFLQIDKIIELDKKELEIYNKFATDAVLSVKKDFEIVASNPAVLMGKLLQYATGCVYTGEEQEYNIYHTQKIDALEDLIEENDTDNFLVFYNFKHELVELQKRFKNVRLLKTEQDLKDWNDGKIKLLVCHPQSAGHGLNLQHGGSLMVWLSLPWSLEFYQQANKRLHRSGQKSNVRCFHLIVKNTVEEYVLKVLKGKDANQNQIFLLIKELYERLQLV